jgi:hypothetical protein
MYACHHGVMNRLQLDERGQLTTNWFFYYSSLLESGVSLSEF